VILPAIVSLFYSGLFGLIWITVFILAAMVPEWAQGLLTKDFFFDVAHAWGWLWMSTGFTAAVFLDAVIDRFLPHIHEIDLPRLNLKTLLGTARFLTLLIFVGLAVCIGVLMLYHGEEDEWREKIELVIWLHISFGWATKTLWLYQMPYKLKPI